MEEKDYGLITTSMLDGLSEGLNGNQFLYTAFVSTLTLLFEKGIFTEEEYKKQYEVYKALLLMEE